MAHTFVNTGFETAGATPGLASGWTVAIFATAEEYASYDVAVPEPVEDFEEEWSSNEDGSFVLTATTAAVYDVAQPEAYEDFEEDWSNTPFFLTLPVVAVASYDTLTPEDFEDFEEEWKDNETDVAEFIGLGVDIAAAAYDLGVPESREDFEEEWRSNEDDITVFVGVGTDLVRATYDGENFEDFEETDLRMQTVEVTHIGADGDKLIVTVNGNPVERLCTGAGTVDTERDFLLTAINAAVLADASADGTGKIKLRALVSGDALTVKVEATGTSAKIILQAPPDKTQYWTQTGELAA
jgi:antitoxin (DNA-binding transcriptional repressor) of toxin-antitoxin stability system